jgi:hypothetical protein
VGHPVTLKKSQQQHNKKRQKERCPVLSRSMGAWGDHGICIMLPGKFNTARFQKAF